MELYKNLSDTKKDIFKIIIALIVAVAYFTLSLIQNYKDVQRKVAVSHEKTIVVDSNRYFTVVGCVKKYLNYVQNGSNEEILMLLNEEYRELYGINTYNLSNHIPKLEKEALYDYLGNEMYQKKISKSVTEYYVNGRIVKSVLDESNEYINYDLTIILYENEFTFSVRPGVGEI